MGRIEDDRKGTEMEISQFFIKGDMKGAIAYMREHEEFRDVLPAYTAIFEEREYRAFEVPERLNEILEAVLNPRDVKKPEKETVSGVFRQGDKVMQIKNNYQLEWEVRDRYGIPVDKGTVIITRINVFFTACRKYGSCRTYEKLYNPMPNDVWDAELYPSSTEYTSTSISGYTINIPRNMIAGRRYSHPLRFLLSIVFPPCSQASK